MKTISRNHLFEIIKNSTFFIGVEYIKKNGEKRTACALMKIKNPAIPVKGVGISREEKYNKYALIQYYDMNKHAFRCFSIDRVLRVRINGEVYEII